MLSLERAKKSPTIFRRLTGLSLQAFKELMENLEKAYPEFEKRRLSRKDRKRAIGAGGKFKLSLAERVFMTLFFLRHYPTYALLGFLFDLHESNAFRDSSITKDFFERPYPFAREDKGEKDKLI